MANSSYPVSLLVGKRLVTTVNGGLEDCEGECPPSFAQVDLVIHLFVALADRQFHLEWAFLRRIFPDSHGFRGRMIYCELGTMVEGAF